MNDMRDAVTSLFDTSEERRNAILGTGAVTGLWGLSSIYSGIKTLYPEDALMIAGVGGITLAGLGAMGLIGYGKKLGQIQEPTVIPQIPQEEIREVVARNNDVEVEDDIVVVENNIEQDSISEDLTDEQNITPLTIADTRQRDGMIKAMSRSIHLLIKGQTGGGKTLMGSHIAKMCIKDGCELVVFDPDASIGKWSNPEDENIIVYGGGDDYLEMDRGFDLLKTEIEKRRVARKNGIRKFPKSIILIDEAPDVLRLTENGRIVCEDLLRRARKLNIMLILLSQDTQVKTLSFQGSSKLLENFSYVALMKFNKATGERTMEIDSETFEQPMEFVTPYLEDPEAHLPLVEYQSTMMDTLKSSVVPRKQRDEFAEMEVENDPENPPLRLIVRQIKNANKRDSGLTIGQNIVTEGDIQAVKILNGIFGDNNHRKQISVLVWDTHSRYHYDVINEILGDKQYE